MEKYRNERRGRKNRLILRDDDLNTFFSRRPLVRQILRKIWFDSEHATKVIFQMVVFEIV